MWLWAEEVWLYGCELRRCGCVVVRYRLDFFYALILCQSAFQREIFFKSDDANRPNQPTSRNSIKWDNFAKFVRFG